ncbi:MAG: hypothetical protein U9P44_00090, partial [archaeon]|nr:hypothetical protein [archaeon]
FSTAVFMAGAYSVDKNIVGGNGYDAGYETGYKTAWDNATEIVGASMFFETSDEIYSINGVVKNISLSTSTLTIETSPFFMNPLLEDSTQKIRKINTNQDTTIIKITMKTPEEMEAMINKNGEFVPFSEEKITFDQIKIGDSINVNSDKNIKTETEITATRITMND